MNRIFYLLPLLMTFDRKITEGCERGEECVTDLTQEDCDENEYLIARTSVHGCCPSCERMEITGLCGLSVPCPPGMECVDQACTPDEGSCWVYLHKKNVKNKPKCNMDGTYAPVQCKGDSITGRCFCADEKGKRIYGISWMENAENMSCACSRKRAELEKYRNNVTLHCSSEGNYEPLQCDSGLCWCADPLTGEPISHVLISDLVSQLPCFNLNTFGDQYLRKCDSELYAGEEIKNVLALHGTTKVTLEPIFCDYDGTYGFYQIDNGIAYCSWKDGKRIENWASDASVNFKNLTCNCARDKKYFEEAGKQFTKFCLFNGNYNPLQQVGDVSFCVDRDGFPTTDEFPEGVNLNCTGAPYPEII